MESTDPAGRPDIALEALRTILRECDPARARCPLLVTHQYGGSGVHLGTRRAPCVLPAGHTRACSDIPRDIGWPGYDVLDALVEEVITLRAAAKELQKIHEDLQEIVADQGRLALSQETELRKWRRPDAGGERLAAMRAQHERSDPREIAPKVAYITALEHALGHVQDGVANPAWRAIADEMPPKTGTVLLGNAYGVLGQFSGVTCHSAATANNRPWAGATWFIDDALYDGDDDPTHWIAIPAVPA